MINRKRRRLSSCRSDGEQGWEWIWWMGWPLAGPNPHHPLWLRRRLRQVEEAACHAVLTASEKAAKAIKDGVELAQVWMDEGKREEAAAALRRLAEAYAGERAVMVVALRMAQWVTEHEGISVEEALERLAGSDDAMASPARFAKVWLQMRQKTLKEKVHAYSALAGEYPCHSDWQAWAWAQIGKEYLLQGKVAEARRWYRRAFRHARRFSPPWCKMSRLLREMA